MGCLGTETKAQQKMAADSPLVVCTLGAGSRVGGDGPSTAWVLFISGPQKDTS